MHKLILLSRLKDVYVNLDRLSSSLIFYFLPLVLQNPSVDLYAVGSGVFSIVPQRLH